MVYYLRKNEVGNARVTENGNWVLDFKVFKVDIDEINFSNCK
jgi:hypothetical protein